VRHPAGVIAFCVDEYFYRSGIPYLARMFEAPGELGLPLVVDLHDAQAERLEVFGCKFSVLRNPFLAGSAAVIPGAVNARLGLEFDIVL